LEFVVWDISYSRAVALYRLCSINPVISIYASLLFGGEMNWNWAYIRKHILTFFSMIERR
jgi:hypothetical protein